MGPSGMNEKSDVEVSDAEAPGSGPGAVPAVEELPGAPGPAVEAWEGRDDVIVLEDDGGWDE